MTEFASQGNTASALQLNQQLLSPGIWYNYFDVAEESNIGPTISVVDLSKGSVCQPIYSNSFVLTGVEFYPIIPDDPGNASLQISVYELSGGVPTGSALQSLQIPLTTIQRKITAAVDPIFGGAIANYNAPVPPNVSNVPWPNGVISDNNTIVLLCPKDSNGNPSNQVFSASLSTSGIALWNTCPSLPVTPATLTGFIFNDYIYVAAFVLHNSTSPYSLDCLFYNASIDGSGNIGSWTLLSQSTGIWSTSSGTINTPSVWSAPIYSIDAQADFPFVYCHATTASASFSEYAIGSGITSGQFAGIYFGYGTNNNIPIPGNFSNISCTPCYAQYGQASAILSTYSANSNLYRTVTYGSSSAILDFEGILPSVLDGFSMTTAANASMNAFIGYSALNSAPELGATFANTPAPNNFPGWGTNIYKMLVDLSSATPTGTTNAPIGQYGFGPVLTNSLGQNYLIYGCGSSSGLNASIVPLTQYEAIRVPFKFAVPSGSANTYGIVYELINGNSGNTCQLAMVAPSVTTSYCQASKASQQISNTWTAQNGWVAGLVFTTGTVSGLYEGYLDGPFPADWEVVYNSQVTRLPYCIMSINGTEGTVSFPQYEAAFNINTSGLDYDFGYFFGVKNQGVTT